MFREFFVEVKNRHGVTGKALSEQTGISQKHISAYIRGKRQVTDEVLWRLIEAMDKLSPGALRDFANKIVGDRNYQISYKKMQEDDEKFAQTLMDLVKAWKSSKAEKISNSRIQLSAK